MNEMQFSEFFHDVMITVHANIRDLREKQAFADSEEQSYLEGRLFSYQEILEIFRMSAKETGIEPKKLGL